jgi:urease accessory protein
MLTTPAKPMVSSTEAPITEAALMRLMVWLSPAYPTGAFSFSSGIEWAVETGDIKDAISLERWIRVLIADGSVACDAVFFAHAWRAIEAMDDDALRAVAEFAAAFVTSKERLLETTAQGNAFFSATQAAWSCPALGRLASVWQGPLAYPIAVGVAAAGHGIALETALTAFVQGIAANLVSAGVRLIPLGQSDGLRVLALLESTIVATARRAPATSLDDVGTSAFRADIAGMRHETQYTRLFRS